MRTTAPLLFALALAAAAPAAAAAELHWAVAIGQGYYHHSGAEECEAERAVLAACAADHGAQSCRIAEVRRDGERWEAFALARREFYASDERGQLGAERAALSACLAAAHFEQCRIAERSRPARRDLAVDPPPRGPREQHRDPFDGDGEPALRWTLWTSHGEPER